ncbi:MAG: hypothetical protein ABF904_08800 [Ethanoligenens sp.]|jgi:hypothetical protein
MNFFQNSEDLLGSKEAEQPGSVTDLLRLAAEIRTKLGGEGYLIESYLSRFFQAVIASCSQEAVSDGYEASSELRDLCFYALDAASGDSSPHKHRSFQLTDTDAEAETHPFYPEVKQHFEESPDQSAQRFTVVNRHYALLSEEFLQYAMSRFLSDKKENITEVLQNADLNMLYDGISAVVREPLMERLNRMLKEQFLAVPASMGFSYGLSCALLDSLVYEDSETGKQMFQLLMDDCSETLK